MDKYDWQATESGPKGYPMQVISGTLFYRGEDHGLYVPDRATIYHGWGKGVSSHVTGADLKPLPDRLEITFFSYTENQFYKGKFDLPYEKILALFNSGYVLSSEEKRLTYLQLVVGVAPGGVVAVWAQGINKTTEVFFGQAEKAEVDWKRIIDNPKYPEDRREEYAQKVIKNSLTPEAVESLSKNGIPFGRWNTYRTRYPWQPVFTGMQLKNGRIAQIKYFNGEDDYLTLPLEPAIAASPRPVPSEVHFSWLRPNAKSMSFELYFNEAEIFAAFKALGGNKQPLQLEMLMVKTEKSHDFTIWLRNDKDKIELKLTNVKTYG